MSEPSHDGDFPAAPEQVYFRAIEDLFIRLRGAPLSLSPADFQVAEEWYREGIPLPLIEGALGDFFVRRKKRGSTRRVSSLRICRPAVEGAWEQVRELQATGASRRSPGSDGALDEADVRRRLHALGRHLPVALPHREDWERRLESLGGTPSAVEEELEALDQEIVAALESGLDSGTRLEIASQVERALVNLTDRLPEDELAQARRRLRVQKVRARFQLPVLSLFSTEAEAESQEEAGTGRDAP